MDLDGRNKRDVSGDGGDFLWLQCSPDGKRSLSRELSIFIANADGTASSTFHRRSVPLVRMWSPDGRWLIYRRRTWPQQSVCHHSDGRGGLKNFAVRRLQGWILLLMSTTSIRAAADAPLVYQRTGLWSLRLRQNATTETQVDLHRSSPQLTNWRCSILHPKPSSDGKWCCMDR